MNLSFSPKQLRDNQSGTYLKELGKEGYQPCDILNFYGEEFVVIHQNKLKPGRNTMDVISIQGFNEDSEFRVARSGQGHAFCYIGEGLSLLVEYKGRLTDFAHPPEQVLVFNITKPTRKDILEVNEELMDAMEANTP